MKYFIRGVSWFANKLWRLSIWLADISGELEMWSDRLWWQWYTEPDVRQ